MTRFAIFSDIHANLPAMEAVKASNVSGVFEGNVCLGDLGGNASQPNEFQELIQAMGCPTIMGNCDEGVGFNKDDCG